MALGASRKTPAAMSEANGGGSLATAALLLAIATVGLGVAGAAELSRAYQANEIVASETWLSYRLWLARISSRADTNDEKSAAIADRLLLMSADVRRATIAAMTSGRFWEGAADSEEGRQTLLALQEQGTLRALAAAPASGDLWLLEAQLRTRLGGFDEMAGRALDASWLFAPLEGAVIRPRVLFAGPIAPLLADRQQVSLQRDISVLRRTDPGFLAEISAALPPDLR